MKNHKFWILLFLVLGAFCFINPITAADKGGAGSGGGGDDVAAATAAATAAASGKQPERKVRVYADDDGAVIDKDDFFVSPFLTEDDQRLPEYVPRKPRLAPVKTVAKESFALLNDIIKPLFDILLWDIFMVMICHIFKAHSYIRMIAGVITLFSLAFTVFISLRAVHLVLNYVISFIFYNTMTTVFTLSMILVPITYLLNFGISNIGNHVSLMINGIKNIGVWYFNNLVERADGLVANIVRIGISISPIFIFYSVPSFLLSIPGSENVEDGLVLIKDSFVFYSSAWMLVVSIFWNVMDFSTSNFPSRYHYSTLMASFILLIWKVPYSPSKSPKGRKSKKSV